MFLILHLQQTTPSFCMKASLVFVLKGNIIKRCCTRKSYQKNTIETKLQHDAEAVV